MKARIIIIALVIAAFLAASLGTSQVLGVFQEQPPAQSAEASAQPAVPSAGLEESLASIETEAETAQGRASYLNEQGATGEFSALPSTPSDAEVLIAVLDTGIDEKHRELNGRVVDSINFSESKVVTDVNGHGTHVAGIIVTTVNSVAAGTNPHVHLLDVKVAEDDGTVWSSTVARGIIWAVDNGAEIINISLYVPTSSPALEEAVGYAWSKGVVVVAGAGNNIKGVPVYPASYPEVIAVAATDAEGRLWEKSNYGDWIDVYAPGVDILSTLPGNGYGYMSGTSMAAAYVSAIAAVVYATATDDDGDGFVNNEVADLLKTLLSLPQ